MKISKLLFILFILLLGIYVNFERSKVMINVIHVENPVALETFANIIKQRFFILYGYTPKLVVDIGKSNILLYSTNDVSQILQKGEFIGIQNGKEVLNNSDILGANFVGPITINKTKEFEIFIFLKNNSLQKINLNQPLYLFVDRPKNVIILFDTSQLSNFYLQDQILALQSALSFTNDSIPIFFYSNYSQLDSLLPQIQKFKNYTILYSSPLPQEFVDRVNSLNITLTKTYLTPNFIGSTLISWDAIGLKRVINYPKTELQPFLNQSIIGFFEVYFSNTSLELNKIKLFVALLSTFPLKDVKLLYSIQPKFNYFEFLSFFVAFCVASLLTLRDGNRIESFAKEACFALSSILLLGFEPSIYLAIFFSLFLPKDLFTLVLISSLLIISSLFSSFLSAFFLSSLIFLLLEYLEKKI
ncbi:MAG: hypothetical protein ACP5FX_01780 [Candidatus Micrarchaeia archaeon]|jgi:hypothetical protein